MNTIITSRTQILDAACALAARDGHEALTIRRVAQACGISVGSVYNYFPSKADLTVATLETVWRGVFHSGTSGAAEGCTPPESFCEAVRTLFARTRAGTAAYPAFFSSHAAGLSTQEKAKGRAMMQRYFSHMEHGLLVSLQADGSVRTGIFNSVLTQEAFVHFVFEHMLLLLQTGASDCDTLLAIIVRVITPQACGHSA